MSKHKDRPPLYDPLAPRSRQAPAAGRATRGGLHGGAQGGGAQPANLAHAVVRRLGPLQVGPPVVVAEGKDTQQNNGNFRFDVIWKEPSFAVLNKQPNAALLFQRYNPGHFGNFAPLAEFSSRDFQHTKKVNDAEKQWTDAISLAWFAHFCQSSQSLDPKFMKEIQKRRADALAGQAWIELPVQTTGRSAVGLAQAAPYENAGWAFHHTYGFPILPAASLKGLANHFLLEEWGWALDHKDGRGKRPLAEVPELKATCEVLAGSGGPLLAPGATAQHLADLLFGAADAGEGAIVFLDAWPCAASGWFEVDVLTPHHLEYYGADSGVKPSDGDEPKPHQFLVVKKSVEFRLHLGLARWAIGLEKARRDALLAAAKTVVLAALERWGIGAKTASGYGRMGEPLAKGGGE